ncbi:hypothetical protein NW766_007214 [Fusarium irregulare]|uniref:Uncharacterized protein n=1 Tax=Fusarium irregulare TaxID=2494466 RepID=A0A9W8PNP4_9HYPO|nr:hypothetical protein NW766_007214 [Fusarium irregulare]
MNEDLQQHLSGQTYGTDVQAKRRPNKPSPVEILNEYETNRQVRLLVDRVVQSCPKPMFIPALNIENDVDIVNTELTSDDAEGLEFEFQSFVRTMNLDLDKLKKNQNNDTDGRRISRPAPVDVLNEYDSDPQVRLLVDRVVKLCPRPTLIPVLNKHVTTGQAGNRDEMLVAPKAFILVHDVQLLFFAPQAWDRDRPYTRDASDYLHRFPTPAEVGGDTEKRVADTFSMEDLHRAILLFYHSVVRRLGRGAWIGRPAPTKKSQFPGYVKPELAWLADVPDAPISGTARLRLAEAIQMEGAAMSQRKIRARAREYNREMREKEREEGRIPFPDRVFPPDPEAPVPIDGLDAVDISIQFLEMAQPSRIIKLRVPQRAKDESIDEMEPISAEGFRAEINFEDRLARTRKTITSLDRFVPEGDVNAFLERQSRSNVVVDFLLDHPDQQEEMMRLSRFQYNLEHTLASLQPGNGQDLQDICREYDITPWPDLKLYSADDGRFVQPLKPHQVDDKDVNAFMKKQRESEVVSDFARQHPEQ